MRRVLTGVDARGRSCVVDDADVETRSIEGLAIRAGSLFATESSPPPPPPRQSGNHHAANVPPGVLHWIVVDHPAPQIGGEPDISATMHHLDAIELVFVVSGSTRLVLEADTCDVGPGDCVVLPGTNHKWEDGEDGCRLLVLTIGTPPAA